MAEDMTPERWREIERLYQLVQQRDPGEREAFLRDACAGDNGLHAEVAALLANESRIDRFIESPAMDDAAKGLAREQAQPTLEAGQMLGHYRVLAEIGHGGMGVVYKAEDSKLKRAVALKCLPNAFAADPERLARFDREARLLASLNHPNIAAIYGLEEDTGKLFLVLELVEGSTLAERLRKGRLSVEEALQICHGIAEGLEAAHEKGIIHRDLKPANVKITPESKVKVLDFGLAKAFHEETSAPDASHSPTLIDQMTRPGVILGTAAYMSPEQAKGKPADKRADIWAFGCILYECLTGKAPFKGETVTETVAKILEGAPDWNLLPVATPWRTKDLLHRCLQRNPNVRLHDIGDARIEIGESLSDPLQVIPVAQRFPLRWMLVVGTVTLLVGILIGPAVMKQFGSPVSPPVIRTIVNVDSDYCLAGQRRPTPPGFDQPTRTAMAISSDGRFIVYSAVKKNPGTQDKPHLYLRRLDQMAAMPVAGTEGGISPFLSPDDRWVGFWADGKLKKVPVEGGVATDLCNVALPFGFSWGGDNQIVFAPAENVGLSRISADGGKPEALTVADRLNEEYGHRLPHHITDGKGILFTIARHAWDWQPRVAVFDPTKRKYRILLEDAADAQYISTGHLAFLRQGRLMLISFDTDKLAVLGQPFPVINNVTQALNTGNSNLDTAAGQFSISASGSLVFAAGGIFPDRENYLVWVDHNGIAEPIASSKGPFYCPRLSPDGQHIAFRTTGKTRQIYAYDLYRSTPTKLTSDGRAGYVVWDPDDRQLVFGWSKTGLQNIYRQPADGSSQMERLTTREYDQEPGSWSPKGEILAFIELHVESSLDIMLLHLSDRKVTSFLNSRCRETYPEFSPDGRWIAYGSDESGSAEVYVQPFPGPGGKWKISNEGGTEPLWSRNGTQLFYRRPNQVWVVNVQSQPSFSPSEPRLLFEQRGYISASPIRSWDISPDGQRFLMVKMEDRNSQPITEMILVQNWFEELKRLVPTGKK